MLKRLCVAVCLFSALAFARHEPLFAASGTSDVILLNGEIYTAASSQEGRWVQALAIRGDRILAVGSSAEVRRTMGPGTRVIDLQGRMVIPGITDSHVHFLLGSTLLDGFYFDTAETRVPVEDKAFGARLAEVARRTPGNGPLIGRAWFGTFSDSPQQGPDKALLDRIVPDRPVVIHHPTEHSYFVNSSALRMAGIGRQPLSNPLEEKGVVRDAGGDPTGVIEEAAMRVVERRLPPVPIDRQVSRLERGERLLNSLGITSIVTASGGPDDLAAYAEMRRQGKLTVRVRQAFAEIATRQVLTPAFLSALEDARSRYHDDWISANLVKFFMDGVPGTPLLYTLPEFTGLVTELDRRGVRVMTHSLSAEATSQVLDAYQAVERTNGARDRRWRIEHANFIDPADVARFHALKVIASMQPAFCCYSTMTSDLYASLRGRGGGIAFGSDWPVSWPPNPFVGMRQAAMRFVVEGPPLSPVAKPFRPDNSPAERLSMEEALLAYTRDAAYANMTDASLGTLEPGKFADLAVLSQNILEVPGEQVGDTKVLLTIVGGRIVHRDGIGLDGGKP